MIRIRLFVLCLLLCVVPVSAMDVVDVEAISSGEFVADDDSVYSLVIVRNVDPQCVSNFTLDSETYSFEVNITYLNYFSSDVDTSFYSKVSGNTSTYSDTWYHILPFDNLYFELGSGNYDLQGLVTGGVRVSRLLSDELVFAPGNFSIVSDFPVDIRFYEIAYDETGAVDLSGVIIELIAEIPVVGVYIADVLLIVKSVTSAFLTLAVVCITNWAFFLVLFETMVFFHATSVLQKKERKKSSEAITASFMAIGSDNKMLFDFLVNVFTKIIDMFTGAVRMFRG